MRISALILAAVVLSLGAGRSAFAEDLEPADEPRHGGWQFEVTPYVWLPETHGTVGADGLTADVDVGFDDVFDLLGDGDLLALMGHFEARKGKLALFTDQIGVVIDTEADGKIFRDRIKADAEADLDLVTVELGAAYRLLERKHFVYEALAGIRYTHAHIGVGVELDAAVGERSRSQDASQDFVDPFIGGRGAVPIGAGVSLVFRGDVGGFGAGSELAWVVLGGLRYDLPWRAGAAGFSLFGGYKVYDVDYENGAGGGKRKVDVQMRGPALGVTITF